MAAKVLLGDIVFSPGPRNKIQFNNPRSIAKMDIPGSAPGYQDMGPDETTLSWSGYLIGDDAYKKAIQIESLKDAGEEVQLIVSDFPELSKKVRIRSFPWDVIRINRIEYSIELVAEILPAVTNILTTTTTSETTETKVTASATAGQTYIIKQGDTLWAIAASYLGTGTRWREIAVLNNISNPRALQIGQSINIPS